MNGLDLAIMVLLAISLYKGVREGFIRQFSLLVAIVLGFMCASSLALYTQPFLVSAFRLSLKQAHTVSLGLSFVLILILVFFVGRLLTKIISVTPLGILNRLLGMAVAALIMCTILGYLFIFVDTIFLPITTTVAQVQERVAEFNGQKPVMVTMPLKSVEDIRNQSKLYYPIKHFVPTILTPSLLHKEGELSRP